ELGGPGGPLPPAVLRNRWRSAVLLAQRQAAVLLACPRLAVLLARLRLVHPAPPICTAIRQHRAWPGWGELGQAGRAPTPTSRSCAAPWSSAAACGASSSPSACGAS